MFPVLIVVKVDVCSGFILYRFSANFFLSSWVVKHFFFFSFFGRASLPFRTLTLDYPDVLWPMVGEVALNPPD